MSEKGRPGLTCRLLLGGSLANASIRVLDSLSVVNDFAEGGLQIL